MREIREATKALNPIKTKLRAFEGQKVSVPGGRVAIGVSKEAVYGYAIFVDRGVWNRLDDTGLDGRARYGQPRRGRRQRVRERVVHRALGFFALH